MIVLRRSTFALFVLIIPLSAQAQESGLHFLRLGPDARAMALGDAHVALSRDAYSTYWNAAGLAAAERNSAAISHHIWIADVKTYVVATRLGLGSKGAIGFSATATGTSELEARDGPGDPAGLFDAQFMSIVAAYGRQIGPMRLGLAAKYLSEEIYVSSASGYAFDVGVQADALADAVRFGASLQNLGKMSRLGSEASRLPSMLRGGIALFPFRILSIDDGASLVNGFATVELSHVLPSKTTRLHTGVGAEVMDLVSIRFGYVSNDAVRSFTFGLGIEYEPFRIDYAYLPFETGFEGPGHVISLSYSW